MQFPYSQIPDAFQADERTSSFMEDARKLMSTINLLGEGLGLYTGMGSPEGVVTANRGSLYLRQDGGATTTLYVKESGSDSSGWVGK